jgi:hypothetical protein
MEHPRATRIRVLYCVTEDDSMSQIHIITAHSLRESEDGARESNEKIPIVIFEGCCSQRKGDYNVGHWTY